MKKIGFTLAEVLITLAIIGIVAALTIPTLIQNYQTRAWNTASQVFQRKLGEALRVMNVQGTLAGYTTTEAFVDELSKHIKITRICDNDDITTCFSDTVTWGTENEEVEMSKIKKAKNFGQEDWDTETIGLQFANGTTGIIAYNPECKQNPYSNQITGTSCIALLYDTTGFKKPNQQLKDLRSINVLNLGNNCAIELNGVCFSAPFKPQALTYNECESLKQELGIEKCCTWCHGQDSWSGTISPEEAGPDYWSGSIKTCKEMGGRFPTMAELATLANELYNTNNIEAYTDNYFPARLDRDKLASYGFSDYGSYFCLRSSETRINGFLDNKVYGRYFGSGSTGWNYTCTSREKSDTLAICVIE